MAASDRVQSFTYGNGSPEKRAKQPELPHPSLMIEDIVNKIFDFVEPDQAGTVCKTWHRALLKKTATKFVEKKPLIKGIDAFILTLPEHSAKKVAFQKARQDIQEAFAEKQLFRQLPTKQTFATFYVKLATKMKPLFIYNDIKFDELVDHEEVGDTFYKLLGLTSGFNDANNVQFLAVLNTAFEERAAHASNGVFEDYIANLGILLTHCGKDVFNKFMNNFCTEVQLTRKQQLEVLKHIAQYLTASLVNVHNRLWLLYFIGGYRKYGIIEGEAYQKYPFDDNSLTIEFLNSLLSHLDEIYESGDTDRTYPIEYLQVCRHLLVYLNKKVQLNEEQQGDLRERSADFSKIDAHHQLKLKTQENIRKGDFLCEKDRLDEALESLKEAAVLGDRDAMQRIASIYMVKEDLEQAYQWFKKAADLGDSLSIAQAAVYLFNGDGVKKDEQKALPDLRKSIFQKHWFVIPLLEDFYQRKEDAENLFKLYFDIATHDDEENIDNMSKLAFCYRQGKGCPKDEAEANKWESKVAEIKRERNAELAESDEE